MYMLLLYTYPRGQSYFDSAFSPRRITSRLAAEFAFLTKRLDESIHVYILHVHYSLVSFFFSFFLIYIFSCPHSINTAVYMPVLKFFILTCKYIYFIYTFNV